MLHTLLRPAAKRRKFPRRFGPAAAAMSLVMLAVFSVQAGGEAAPTPGNLTRASVTVPAAAASQPAILGTAPQADERCNPLTGTCRALPGENRADNDLDGLSRDITDESERRINTLW